MFKKTLTLLIIASLTACGAGGSPNNNNHIKPDIDPVSYLAKPTGQYGVGYQDVHLLNTDLGKDKYATDENHNDFSPDNPKQIHEMMVRVYYPTLSKQELKEAYYAPILNEFKEQLDGLSAKISKEELQKYTLSINGIKTFSSKNDHNIINNQKFPIVLFSPGAGCQVQMYENYINNLVSYGYVVVAINSVFMSGNVELPNRHIVKPLSWSKNPEEMRETYLTKYKPEQASDFKFILNNIKDIFINNTPEIASRVNFNAIGAFGHSIGSGIIVNYLHENVKSSKLQAATSFDVGMSFKDREDNTYNAVTNIPFMHQVAAQRLDPKAIANAEKNGQYTPNFSLIGDNDSYVIIHRSNKSDYISTQHMNFSDCSTLFSNQALKFILTSLGFNDIIGTEDGWEFTKLSNDYLVRFFDVYLKKQQDNDLKNCKATSSSIDITCNVKNRQL